MTRHPASPSLSALALAGALVASTAFAPVFADDMERYTQVQQFNADGNPHFPGVNRKTNRLYVSDVNAGTVTMFDSTTGEKPAEIATGAGAHTVMVDRKKNLVYVTNRGTSTSSVLDGTTNAKLADPGGCM